MKSNSESNKKRAIAVGGTRGASGKTIVTLGIIRTLLQHGYTVSPFKKGPDYIDPAWLSLAAQNQCRNLDSFLMNDDIINKSFSYFSSKYDISIIEGNRGLFDGLDIAGTYSFAELVKLLDVPLILIVDCKKASRSIAAMVHGFHTFDPELSIQGIIINNFAGPRHKKIITESIETYCKIPVIGAIPRIPELLLDERHLGLEPIYEHRNPEKIFDLLDPVFSEAIDIEKIIEISETPSFRNIRNLPAAHTPDTAQDITPPSVNSAEILFDDVHEAPAVSNIVIPRKRIGIIRDSAFNFYYIESLEILEKYTDVMYINALADSRLPLIDSLYIGGGFPETHAQQLSDNITLRDDIARFIEDDFPVYAECGGLIYLSQAIISETGEHSMVGIYPYRFELSEKPVGHGYTTFQVDKETPFYHTGDIVKGHEFRYSRIINPNDCADVHTAFAMQRGQGIMNKRDGALYKNALATFSHTHPFSLNANWIKFLTGKK